MTRNDFTVLSHEEYDPEWIKIVVEVLNEVKRQHELWGVQNHPSFDRGVVEDIQNGKDLDIVGKRYGVPDQTSAKKRCEEKAKQGTLTYADIFIEEAAETFEEVLDPEKREEELIQVTAVAVSWLDSIRRNEK
jgi:hypothetical protein